MAKPDISARPLCDLLTVLAARAAEGASMVVISEELGITRQRAHWLLRKHGIVRGQWKKEKPPRLRFGLSLERAAELDALGAISAFQSQRANAKSRAIPWEMTLAEWWSVWEMSGQWANRGRHKGGYVMSRPGDRGPYSAGNVKIISNEENFAEARSHCSRGDGVYCLAPGTSKPWVAKWKNGSPE